MASSGFSVGGDSEATLINTSKHLLTLAAQGKGKKRVTSPAVLSAAPLSHSSSSKKKKLQAGVSHTQILPGDLTDGRLLITSDVGAEPPTKSLPFKNPNFVHSGIGGAAAGKKNRTWKNLKQILAAERTLPWKISDPNYYTIDAPPSLKPQKKYSDISGLPANYTDPQTKLHFTSSEEFSYIRQLPTDVVSGYLALRKATCIVP